MELPCLIENRVFDDNRGVFAPLPLNYDNSDNLEIYSREPKYFVAGP